MDMNSDDRSDESDNRPTFEEFTWQDLFSDDPSLLSAADDHPCGGLPGSQWYTVRRKVARALHITPVQIVIIGLVVCDALIVVMELLMELGALGEEAKRHRAVHGLHYASITILSIFVVELLAKLVCCGPFYFWRHKFELFDAVVVLTSWVLDLIFRESAAETALALLIVLRLWRVVRIVNAIVASVKQHLAKRQKVSEMEMSRLQTRVGQLEQVLRYHQLPLPPPQSGKVED